MKRGAIIGIVIFVVIIGTLIVLPFAFRGVLIERTKTTLDKHLNVNIAFKDFKLSLIHNFPKATLSLRQVLVTGKGSFAGDTLLQIPAVRTSFGLFDLFSPDNLTINEIVLDGPVLKLLVNDQNQVNWEILAQTEGDTGSKTKKVDEKESTFAMQLDKIVISKGLVSYTDMTLPMVLTFSDLNLKVNGKMYGSDTRLFIDGYTSEMNLNYNNIGYISKTRLGVATTMDVDFDQFRFLFSEAELLVNNLPLELNGHFVMPNDSMLFDLNFRSKVSTLAEFLALIPPDYVHYLNDLKASGSASLDGHFKGTYFEDEYPELSVKMQLSGGTMRYADLPEEIRNITARLSVEKPQGKLNLTRIDIPEAHFEIRNNPLDMNLQVSNLFDDIFLSGGIKGKVNFDQLKEALPLDSLDVSGLLDLRLSGQGTLSAIENRQYEKIKTEGMVILSDFVLNSKELTMPIIVSEGKMDFAPENVNLQHLDLKIGESDMVLAGKVSDYYPYLFSGGTLKGDVRLISRYLNLNQMMQLQSGTGAQASQTQKEAKGDIDPTSGASAAPTTFKVPGNLNISFLTDVSRALYDRLVITNVKGYVTMSDGRLDLKDLKMNLLDGELKLTGAYITPPEGNPLVDMSLDLSSFDIPSSFQSLGLVRNYLPIAAQSKGRFSTSLKINGKLNEKMGLVPTSLNGSGLFNSKDVQILNSPVFNRIKSVLNEEKLRDMRIDDFAASFTIENGNLLLRPFKTRLAGQEATFTGRLNADNLIDMNIAFVVNRDALSPNIENTLGFLPGQKNIQMIPVGVTIKGPVNEPEVKVDLSEATQMVKQEIRNATQEEIQKTINKIGDGIRKLIR